MKKIEAPENATKLIVDVRSVLYSAYFWAKNHVEADEFENSSKARNSAILYRFFDKLRLSHMYANTNRMYFCCDSKTSKRKDMFPDYKGKRLKEEKLVECFPFFDRIQYEFLPAMGFKNVYHFEGLEADDIIASICLKEKKLPVVIYSDDADMYQCLKGNVTMMSISRSSESGARIMTVAKFQKLFNINPDMWAEVKSLAGCSTDNIPGYPGVGEVLAIRYLKGELTRGTRKARIEAHPEIRDFTRKLVKLPFNNEILDVSYTPDDFDKEYIIDLFDSYDLSCMIDSMFWNKFFGWKE